MTDDTESHGIPKDRIAAIERRLDRGSERMKAIETTQAQILTELRSNTEITTGVRDYVIAGKVGGRLAVGIGKFAGVVTAIWGLVYLFLHHGQPPK